MRISIEPAGPQHISIVMPTIQHLLAFLIIGRVFTLLLEALYYLGLREGIPDSGCPVTCDRCFRFLAVCQAARVSMIYAFMHTLYTLVLLVLTQSMHNGSRSTGVVYS